MDVTFADDDLARVERGEAVRCRLDQCVVAAFQKVMTFVRDAADERDIRAWKSLRFEKLKGKRSHQNSLRLNDQFRLVIEIEKGNPKNTIRVVAIEDYH